MKRSLRDTNRSVKFVIDNQDRAAVWADGGDTPWTANVYVDGDLVLTEAELGRTPDKAFALIATAIEQSGELDDLPVPIPEKDKELLLRMLEAVATTWDNVKDFPSWRDNEYARGQVELIVETCRVITDEEIADGGFEGDSETLRDRVSTWIEQEVWK